MRYSFVLMLLIFLPCWAQVPPTTGQAATNQPCSIANTGSENKIQINCGIGEKQGQKILALLNRTLASQPDPQAAIARLDHCLQAVQDVKEQQASRFDEQAERLSEIMTAVERLGLSPESLLARYRLGYVIFDINYRNDVFPYRSTTRLDKYELDWSGVELTPPTGCPPSRPELCGPDYIAIRMPGIRLKGGGGGVTGGWKTVFPKKPSRQRGLVMNDIEIDSEILAVRKDGIVFLVGFN